MANKILPGYEMPLGDKLLVIFDHVGPKSYLNVSTASHAGDVVKASDLNRGGFDSISTQVVISTSGNYAVRVYSSKGGGGNAVPSVQLRWFSYPAASTTGALGAEVADTTDLSAETVRLAAIMV